MLTHPTVLLWGFYVLILLIALNGVQAFVHIQRFTLTGITSTAKQRNRSFLGALTPTGPFCPFRSDAAISMESHMEALTDRVGPDDLPTDLARLQLDMQMGNTPDPERLKRIADELTAAVDQWDTLMTRLRLSQDFQTREYAKLTQAHLESHETSVTNVGEAMRWQADCMRAMANNTPPPLPPPRVDLAKLMEQASNPNQQQQSSPPSISAMAAAQQITATPFTGKETAFDSPTVKAEYEQLCRDHMALIQLGSKYAEFDGLGKIYYLDEIDKIQDRWDVFFTRFKLMGALNKDYMKQCDNFLKSMGLNEESYRDLLKKCHQMMREEAEAERNIQGM